MFIFATAAQEEYDRIAAQMVAGGTLVPLTKTPNSFWCHSHPDDVARVEESTFICSKKKKMPARQTTGKIRLHEKKIALSFSRVACEGRTMYVIPYCMGPHRLSLFPHRRRDHRFSLRCVEYADHDAHGRICSRAFGRWSVCSRPAFRGRSLKAGEKDVPWPCNPSNRVIVHFPEERTIWSYGSGYGGNALAGKKMFCPAHCFGNGREGRVAGRAHADFGITNPEGEKKYIAAAFPSACGKTNLAMLTPTLPGWKVETVGDDIAWMQFGADGRLYAINPEAGFFGVAPGTSMRPIPMR